MKELKIDIRLDEKSGKIATAWQTQGYSRENISDLFELVGIIENFKGILTNKIKTLAEKKV